MNFIKQKIHNEKSRQFFIFTPFDMFSIQFPAFIIRIVRCYMYHVKKDHESKMIFSFNRCEIPKKSLNPNHILAQLMCCGIFSRYMSAVSLFVKSIFTPIMKHVQIIIVVFQGAFTHLNAQTHIYHIIRILGAYLTEHVSEKENSIKCCHNL